MKKIKVNEILIPVSNLGDDKIVVDRALQLGKRLKSNLTFLHIKKGRLIKTGAGLNFMEASENDDFSKKEIMDYIKSEKIKKKVSVDVETIEHFDVGEGNAENATGFELVVIGHKKEGFLDRIFGGHTLDKVLNHVNCDVFVVKVPE